MEKSSANRESSSVASRDGMSGSAEFVGAGCESSAGWGAEAPDEDSLKLWWKRIHQHALLTAQQEVALAMRIEQGDEDAFNEMVEANLRLVGSIARKCRRHAGLSMPLADLIQEGSLGLIRAVKKFDHRKGFKFSTYASYWIRQAVMRAIDEQGRSIRLPVHIVESVSKTERARALLTQQLHRSPTERELAFHLRVSEKKMATFAERPSDTLSLDMAVGEEDDSMLVDLIEDRSAPSPIDCASSAALREELERAFVVLSEREKQVLMLRYGMDEGGHARTLDEVGIVLELTRERVRQIEKGALKRLKRSPALRETAQDRIDCHSSGNSRHTHSLA